MLQPSRRCIYLQKSFLAYHVSSFVIESLLVLFVTMSWQLILSRMLRYYRDHYSHWFLRLYCSQRSKSFWNSSTRSFFMFVIFMHSRHADWSLSTKAYEWISKIISFLPDMQIFYRFSLNFRHDIIILQKKNYQTSRKKRLWNVAWRMNVE